jgi:hypothetical protein
MRGPSPQSLPNRSAMFTVTGCFSSRISGLAGDAEQLGDFRLRTPESRENVFAQHFAGMHGPEASHQIGAHQGIVLQVYVD